MPTRTMREQLDFIVRKTAREEAEIVAQAIVEGVSEWYRKQIFDAYLAGELARDDAVLELGETCVADLDYALRAIDADIKWELESA